MLRIVLMLALLSAAACASVSEIQLGPNSWQISYDGPPISGTGAARDQMLRRGLELLQSQGCETYLIGNFSTGRDHRGAVYNSYTKTATNVSRISGTLEIHCVEDGLPVGAALKRLQSDDENPKHRGNCQTQGC